MRTRIVILICLFFLSTALKQAKACDICGCGVGSYYVGILPGFNMRFAGLRYQYKTLTTHLGPQGEHTPLTADETYQTAELWGGWNLSDKFRLLVFVPYNFNERKTPDDLGRKDGLGDIALMGYYRVFESRKSPGNKLLIQSLWAGAGLKVPTGKYEPAEREQSSESPNNFQLGTASTDFTVNAMYDIRLMDLGLNVNANYKINTENKYDYRYGNKLTINSLLYYKIKVLPEMTIAPNAGILYETAEKDIEGGKYHIDVSGGHMLSAVAGLEGTFKKLSFGINYQTVANQHLAGGRVEAGNRMMTHMSLAF